MPVVFVGDDMSLQIFLAVQVDELNVKCNRETVLLLRKLAIDSKVTVVGMFVGSSCLTV